MDEDELKLLPPLFMIGKKIACWKCEGKMTVVALLAPNIVDVEEENEAIVLSDVVELPQPILQYIQSRVPTYKYRYSKTVGGKYFANTCPSCGVISGDFFMHSEPGGPFFPTNEEEAKSLYITEVPLNGPVSIKAGYHIGTGEMILEYARKIA